MQLATFGFSYDDGFTVDSFPELDSPTTGVFVFGAPSLAERPDALEYLARAYPRSLMVGCSTAGEILGTRLSDDSASIAVARFARTRLASATARVSGATGSFEAGRSIARQLVADDLRAVFVLSDGLSVNGSELVRGLRETLPSGVVVTGGLAGDGERFGRTWVLDHGKPVSGSIAGLGFYGDHVRIGHGCRGGWDMFGPERTVTRSTRNILFELDGKPALELYKRYLGDRAAGLPATALLFPLALRCGSDNADRLVRTVLAVDEEAQSMTFAGDIPAGSLVQLMRANFDRLIEGAHDAGRRSAVQPETNEPTLSIAVSCVGRRIVLGERVEEEIEAALDALPAGAQQLGFYSYGEISPYIDPVCDLHNQTMTVTTFTET